MKKQQYKTPLHKKLVEKYGDILTGCVELSKLINKRVSPETLRMACFGQRLSVPVALAIVDVLDFDLYDLRPDLEGRPDA